MRRSTTILTATAVALSISGIGAHAASALEEDTACSRIAGFTVCALAESADDSEAIVAGVWNDDEAVGLGQSRSNHLVTILLADVGAANAIVLQSSDNEDRYIGGQAGVFDSDGNFTGAGAGVYNDNNDSDNDSANVRVGQVDGDGSRWTGLEWTNDDCDVMFGGNVLGGCFMDLWVPVIPVVPYLNLP